MSLPIVALVGKPNTGKSTLLNKIAGGVFAVTSPVAGTTRDRQYIDTSWNGIHFTLVDTAGLAFDDDTELEQNIHKQIDIAVAGCDMVLLVTDGKKPTTAIDQRTLLTFRKLKKPIALVINKADSPNIGKALEQEFSKLGIKPSFAVSAVSGRGIGDMLDFVTESLTKLGKDQETDDKTPGIKVSIVGKTNVGKSSLFNKIIKEERVVVSNVPGTTRTAIDSQIDYKDNIYTFIDTAGLIRKDRNLELPDKFSTFQTFKAMRRSDIALFLIDATQQITKQDQRIAQELIQMEKGVVIVANKFDIYEGEEQSIRDYVSYHFPFLCMSPLFFISAQTGQGIEEVLDAIKPIYDTRQRTATQEELNKLLGHKMKVNPPKLLRDQKKPKVFGLNQIDINPPTFELVVNHPAAISMQFRKTIENGIIKELGFWGTPIRLHLRGKGSHTPDSLVLSQMKKGKSE